MAKRDPSSFRRLAEGATDGADRQVRRARDGVTVLDTIADISLSDEQEALFFNEIQRVRQLRVGFDYLYRRVLRVEQLSSRDPDREIEWVLERPPDAPWPHTALELVHCSFHWYAVSLCNHCALIAAIGQQATPERSDELRGYRREVCGPVLTYRNKVAAHFAWVDPKETDRVPQNNDNPADAMRSTLFDLALVDGRFTVGQLRVSLTARGVQSTSKHAYEWALTSTHELLTQRYGW